MIFNDAFIEKNREIKDGDVIYFCEYIPDGKVNYISDSRSKDLVLAFKKGDMQIIEGIYDAIHEFIGFNFSIAVVPPSRAIMNGKTACHSFANIIISKLGMSNRILDATSCLHRHIDVKPLHNGANRFDEKRADSIKVKNVEFIIGKDVLLIDDIYTTGETMRSCVRKLKEAGARSVVCFAVGRTIDDWHPQYAIIFDLDQTLYDTSSFEKYRKPGKWNEAFKEADRIKATPYNGVRELLEVANKHNFKTCIVTSSPERYARIFADELGINNVVSYGDTEKHKPDIEPYCRAKQLLQVYEKNIIVVGDNEKDIIPAKAMSMISVLIGNDNNCGADYFYATFEEFYNDFDSILSVLYRK